MTNEEIIATYYLVDPKTVQDQHDLVDRLIRSIPLEQRERLFRKVQDDRSLSADASACGNMTCPGCVNSLVSHLRARRHKLCTPN